MLKDFVFLLCLLFHSILSDAVDPRIIALQSLYLSTDGDNWYVNTKWMTQDDPCDWYGVSCGVYFGLNLTENNLQGTIPPDLVELSDLWQLSLSSNKLTGTIPPQLGELTDLHYLSLSSNKITGTIPPELGKLNNLQELHLQDNQISGTIPLALGEIPDLQVLKLSDNQLCGMIPELLSTIPSYSVDGNQFYCPAPEEVEVSSCVSTEDPYPFLDIPQNVALKCNTQTNIDLHFQNWINSNAGATLYEPYKTLTNNWSGDPPECGTIAMVTFTAQDQCGFTIMKNGTFAISSATELPSDSNTPVRIRTSSSTRSSTASTSTSPSKSLTSLTRSLTASTSSSASTTKKLITRSSTASTSSSPSKSLTSLTRSLTASNSASTTKTLSPSAVELLGPTMNPNLNSSNRPSHLPPRPIDADFSSTPSVFPQQQIITNEQGETQFLVEAVDVQGQNLPVSVELITEVPQSRNNPEIVSLLYNITLTTQTELEKAMICFTVDQSIKKSESCLGYFDEVTLNWICEDQCLRETQSGPDRLLCGSTSHFTVFAILLAGGLKNQNKCESDYGWITGSQTGDVFLFVGFLLGAIVIVICILFLTSLKPVKSLIIGEEGKRVYNLKKLQKKSKSRHRSSYHE